MTNGRGNNKAVWISVGLGAGVGLAFALRQRRRDPWASARDVSRRIAAAGSGSLATTAKDLAERIGIIYEQSRKVADDCTELWAHGRKLVGV